VAPWHGSLVPKHAQSVLDAHAAGTSTQYEPSGTPASVPLHTGTQTCEAVHVACVHGVVPRTVLVHVPIAQWTTMAERSEPAGALVPSSARTVPERQPQPGYCISHVASALAKLACALRAMPSAAIVPQQSVWCATAAQSESVVHARSKVGNDAGS